MQMPVGSDESVPSQESPVPKAPTGIRGLDDILYGGLPVARTTLLAGGPGTGKTVLATEFLYRGAEGGEAGVFVSFEEPVEALWANAASMGMDLGALEQAGALKLVHAAVPHGAVRSGQFDIKGLLAILDGHLRAAGAKRLVLDAIDVLMRIFGHPQREREELYMLHDWIRQHGLTAVLTVKAGAEAQRAYAFLDYMADCVIRLDQRMNNEVRTRRLTVVKYRGSGFLNNEYPYVLSPEGVILMPISSASLMQETINEQVSSGNAALDGMLGGGYFRGSCILLAGLSGSGKTSVACTFARAACRRGEKVLYVSFEEAAETLIANMASVGIDLRPAAESGALRILTAMPESMGVEQHLLRIFSTIDAMAPQHVVVDAISAARRMRGEQAAFNLCVRLLTACKEQGITCFYVNQTRSHEHLHEITGMEISSLVDTLIAAVYDDDGRTLTRRLLVVKSRGTAHSRRYHTFDISEQGLQFAADGDGPAAPQPGRAP